MPAKKTLIIITHAPSENTERMLQAVIRGANHPEITNVDVRYIAPLNVRPEDIITAQAIIIGTTENLGYLAGLTKDVFDRCYYPCLEKTQGLPYCLYIRAGHDGTGANNAAKTIVTGLRWREVHAPLICKGDFQESFIAECEELGMFMAAGLESSIF